MPADQENNSAREEGDRAGNCQPCVPFKTSKNSTILVEKGAVKNLIGIGACNK